MQLSTTGINARQMLIRWAASAQVLKALDAYGGKLESEDELKPVEKMMSDAYQEIDKAVVKGIIKLNTASRRKSRLAVAKQNLLIQAGIYTPAAAQTA